MFSQQCDLLVIGVGLTHGRFKVVDVTTPMAFESYRFLIPVQGDTANINAVIKPFQWPVQQQLLRHLSSHLIYCNKIINLRM
jgi:ionotropic glutamate receptor